MNVHGYQNENGRRDLLFESVSRNGKRLWNSEYGEIDGTGLTLARNLHLDFRDLHPTAWCYWQPFDSKGWGLVASNLPNKWFQQVNPKYYVLAQYSRHIRPGMAILETGDTDTVAAYDAAKHKLVLVVRNSERPVIKVFDLSGFRITDGPVASWITEPKRTARYEEVKGANVVGQRLEIVSRADSVQTFEIEHATLSRSLD